MTLSIFRNKFFVSFLVLTVLVLGISVKTAEAKGVARVFSIIAIVIIVVAVVIATSGAGVGIGATISGVTGGAASGIALGSAALISAAALTIGQIACLSGADNPMFSGCGGDGNGGGGGGGSSGASVGSGNVPANCWSVNSTMYIPQLNSTGYNNQCSTPIDETQSQIAIYRYSIPNSSSQSALNDWYLNQIRESGDTLLISASWN